MPTKAKRRRRKTTKTPAAETTPKAAKAKSRNSAGKRTKRKSNCEKHAGEEGEQPTAKKAKHVEKPKDAATSNDEGNDDFDIVGPSCKRLRRTRGSKATEEEGKHGGAATKSKAAPKARSTNRRKKANKGKTPTAEEVAKLEKKQKQSRKSSAYHVAFRKAKCEGLDDEEARKQAKQVPRLNNGL